MSCTCGSGGRVIRILSGIACEFRVKRVCKVFNPSNSKGAAYLSLLTNLRGPSRKRVLLSKRGVRGVNKEGLHRGDVSLIFRSCRLFSCVASLRGMVITTRVDLPSMPGGRLVGVYESDLMVIKLSSDRVAQGIARLSNKRRREITVTETLVASTGCVLTSRPAKGLSGRGQEGVIRLLRRVTRRRSEYIVMMARSSCMGGGYSVYCRVKSSSRRWVITNVREVVERAKTRCAGYCLRVYPSAILQGYGVSEFNGERFLRVFYECNEVLYSY